MTKMPDSTDEQRLAALFLEVQSFYKEHKVESRLDNLALTMLGKPAAPKLRCKAAEARALVPYAAQATERLLNPLVPLELAVRQAAAHLLGCYNNLARDRYDRVAMATHSC